MGSGAEPLARGFSFNTALLPVVLTGTYAWLVAVFPLMGAPGTSPWVAWTGLLALVFLLLSLAIPHRRLAMGSALYGYLAGCLLTWWGASSLESEPRSAGYGALGFVAYTLALGSLSTPSGQQDAVTSPSPKLSPRVRPSWFAALVMGGAGVASLFLFSRALEVPRPELSILAQLCCLGVVILLLKSASHVSHYFQRRGRDRAFAPHLGMTLWFLVGLVALLLAGLATGWAAR